MRTIALAGNPNCGKTTLFNSLTGSTAHVGNWPGVTVDKKEGVYKKTKESLAIIDLPGIYSLSPYTPEEVITRNYILNEKPSCVINVVDATNLERNLYLTTQLLEIDVPVVIALNMMDIVKKNGEKIDPELLSRRMGVPVVCISAQKEENLETLMDITYNESLKTRKGTSVLTEGALSHLISDCKAAFTGLGIENPLFHAIKLVEMDELEVSDHPDLVKIVEEFKNTFNDDVFGSDLEAIAADSRYQYISKNYSTVKVKKEKSEKEKLTKSDKADRVLTNKWAGIPIFLVILFLIFHLTFSGDLFFLGKTINFQSNSFEGTFFEGLLWTTDGINSPGVILFNFLDCVTSGLGGVIEGWMANTPEWVSGLVCNGVLGGLFGVLSFLPQILLLFLFFSILEDTGYMARVAFILDRIFRKFGLSGRAFMPMIMGFGCSVPAMVNTRTLADENERTATIRVIPFFSCGAKLPILTAIAGGIAVAFGFGNPDIITYSMYLVGMLVAIVSVIVMRKTTMKGEVPPFIMELPSYHAPQFKSLMLHLWDKLKHFVKKAFTIILASTIIIWFLSSFGWDWKFVGDNMDASILASLGKLIQPIFTPLGFGSQLSSFGWVFAVAAVTGLIAKEDVLATFFTLACCIVAAVENGMANANIDPEVLKTILEMTEASEDGVIEVQAMIGATGITWQALISFIVFNMTTIPCFAAVATAKAELSKGKFGTTIAFWLVVSYLVSTIVYLVLSWWWTSFIVVALIIASCLGIYFYNKYKTNKGIASKRL